MAKLQNVTAVNIIRIRESDKYDLCSKTVDMVEYIC